MMVNFHHIVADGVSIGLMLDELDVLYRSLTGGGNARPDLDVQYSEYARRQRSAFAGKKYADQLAHWQQRLNGHLPVLELPADRPRPPAQSFKGSNAFADLPLSLVRDLAAIAAREGCTLFTTLLAAFQVLLKRYSGAEDVVIGTPLALRPSEFQSVIGNFLNMVALRCDLTGNPTFLQVLRRTRRTTLQAFARADLPFEHLVEHLTFDRDPSRSPIFQTMLEMLPAVRSTIGDVQVSKYYFDLGFAQFDLSLHIWEDPDRYVCRFEYCTDLFKADTIERMAANFTRLLRGVAADPQQRISSIPILTEHERRLLLETWNHTTAAYPHHRCVHQLFEETAAAFPNRVAIECGDKSVTYGELNAQANRLANYLIQNGVEAQALVGLHLERSIDLVVGLLGILKAGAAYVPMDPSFPPGRLAYMMEDAVIGIVVRDKALFDLLPQPTHGAICVDVESPAVQQQSSENVDRPIRVSHLAYTIYTSGSSGRPKGVAIEHRSAVNLLTSMQRKPGFDARDVLIAVTTISFDIAALEIFLPLISGGRLVVARKGDVLDGSALAELITRSGATVVQGTPSTWKLLLDARPEATRGLKILCGGEAMPRDLADRLLDGGGEVWNMYGPTETTIWSSVLRVERGDGSVPIGPPIANTQFYIVDDALEPAPIGVPGELLIGGEGLARGYRNRPELNAERFINNPFSNDGNRVYRTGDIARFRSDGCIEFVGRRDFQVKVRGYRIELEEIEHVLAQHDGVKDVAVVTWEDGGGDKRLVAYYIPDPEHRPEIRELKGHVQERLPEYMCPSFFVELQNFPSTPNGKVDRKAFPNPEVTRAPTGSLHVAPQSELEARLARLWRQVLRLASIGIDDNFFDLGGHSLLAARLFAMIERELGVRLPLALFFQAPTIRRLAAKLEQRTWKSNWNSLVPIQAAGSRPPLFLMHGAEGNVLLYRTLAQTLGTDQPVYALQARGLDGRGALEQTFGEMAAKYVEEIKLVQPEGPYHLGGYCLGGTIALEVAQRLKSEGRTVALLAMIDSYNIRSAPPLSKPLRALHAAQNLYFQTRNVLLSLRGGSSRFFVEKGRIEVSRFKVRCDILATRVMNRFSRRPTNYQHLLIQSVNDRAQSMYKPEPYEGRIVLFKPKGHFSRLSDRHFGWSAIAQHGVHIVEMPNYPRGSLNHPFVKVLANALAKEMNTAIQNQ
ncbi:MAG: non-ribosomal peptide synthetase [Acidobacteria bacterium]|nr:MAG: non-ribosomal peptide synthetase [Acidobacteriota bacterium]